jgi:Tfp pilus assembly protein PilF
MKRNRSLCFRLCAWAQVLLLLIVYLPVLPALAASSGDLSFADLTKLSSLETVIYGTSYKNLPSDKRIGSLERVVFGKVHKGTLPDRLKAVVSAVNGEHSSLLAPPMAPELDHSDPATKSATPNIAPQAAVQSSNFADDMPPTAEGDRVKTMLVQATRLYSQGQTDQSETMFKNVLALDSHNSDANFNLGAIAENRSDWQNALNYYQAALSTRPEDKDIQQAVQSMQAKVKSGQMSATPPANQYQQPQAAKLSEPQMEALRQKVNQAASYYQNGNYDAAVSILREVANQAPNQADVQYALGQAYRAQGQNAYARSALAQAVNLAPNNQDYRNALNELDQQMAAGANNRSTDSFGNNNNYGNNALANQNNAPEGQLTPFTGDNGSADNQGWQSTASPTRFYSGSSGFMGGPSYGYMPGYASGGYSPYGMGGYGFGGSAGTAAMAGLAGLAIGSMFGLMMSHHHRY